MRGFLRFSLKAAVGLAILGGVVFGVMRLLFLTPVTITHQGMAPTLLAGERVLMWRDRDLELGDIAVCVHPERNETVIGRVLGMTNNTVETERGRVLVSGSEATRDIMGDIAFFNSDVGQSVDVKRVLLEFGNTTHEVFEDERELRFATVQVPSGSVYLLGDNRPDATHDSRTYGPMPESSCIGVVFMRTEPVDIGLDLGHSWLEFL
ncbi:MAG: signal peptidase I [Myxococcota bacterium]